MHSNMFFSANYSPFIQHCYSGVCEIQMALNHMIDASAVDRPILRKDLIALLTFICSWTFLLFLQNLNSECDEHILELPVIAAWLTYCGSRDFYKLCPFGQTEVRVHRSLSFSFHAPPFMLMKFITTCTIFLLLDLPESVSGDMGDRECSSGEPTWLTLHELSTLVARWGRCCVHHLNLCIQDLFSDWCLPCYGCLWYNDIL